jgi:diaminopimelate epimerase
MDHALSQARQRTVMAIARERQRIADEANAAIAELNEAEKDLAATYAAGAGIEGECAFALTATAVVLREAEREEATDVAVPTSPT